MNRAGKRWEGRHERAKWRRAMAAAAAPAVALPAHLQLVATRRRKRVTRQLVARVARGFRGLSPGRSSSWPA